MYNCPFITMTNTISHLGTVCCWKCSFTRTSLVIRQGWQSSYNCPFITMTFL